MIAGLVLAAVPAAIFPGDAQFINDEPLLIISALRSNHAHALAQVGLPGNKGVKYGPLPTWFYQLALLVTHDPVSLIVVHGASLAAVTFGALYWLARTTRLWPAFAVVIALSPYLWFLGRPLWDNTFNIPISALVFAAYADFLSRRSRAALAVAVAGLAMAPFVHLMSAALVIPFALHMLVFERRALVRHAWLLAPVPLLLIVLSRGYLRDLVSGLSSGGVSTGPLRIEGFLFPFRGARLLSGLGFGEGWIGGPAVTAARIASALAYPLAWAGMAIAAVRAVKLARDRVAAVQDHVAVIALAVVAAQIVLDGFMRSFGWTHYLTSTWIAYAVLAWLAADAIRQATSPWVRALRWAVTIQAAGLAVLTIALVTATHRAPGWHYPTIEHQVEVAREVLRYPPGTPVVTDVPLYKNYPHALTAMRMLVEPAPGPAGVARQLVIRPRSADPSDGRLTVAAE